MPLLLRAAFLWVLATAAGLTDASGAIAVGLLLLWRQQPIGIAALVLVCAAGLELGSDLRHADARCLAEAAVPQVWALRIEAPAAPGGFVRAVGLHRRCHLPVWIAVRGGEASAGSVVRITHAEPSAANGVLLLRDARLQLVRGPGPLDRWRNTTAAKLETLFGPDAPMARALLIADTRGLAAEIRERYADAGLVHILSISGLHVAIVGGALLLFFQALRLSPTAAGCAALAVTALYVLAIGAPPPAVRSATLFAATTFTQLLQRPVSPWGAFALGALVPLVEPRTVLDLGWQLSVAGYAAIIVSGRMARRRFPERWRGWRRTLARELLTGTLTTAATAPLVTWHFGRLSLVSPLSNLVAGPVVTLMQPTLFLSMLTPVTAGAEFTADAARPLLRTLDLIAATAASLPGASIVVAPTRVAAILAAAAVAAVLVAGWVRHWRPPLVVAIAAFASIAWLPAGIPVRGAGLELHLLDVGQGDAIALRSPRGRWVIIDAGRQWSAGDAGRATIIPYLRRRGGELAMLVLTHPHADHIGGAASVLRALRPRELRDAAFVERSATYRSVLREAAELGTRWQRVRPGEVVDLDGVSIEFLAPDSAWTTQLGDPNEASTVVRVRYGSVRMLLMGDAEHGEESWLLEHARGALRADVLKVGHHGSRTSSTQPFLDAVAPRVALVSVGAANLYGHPNPEVMQRLSDLGATVLRTDQLGTIVLHTDGTTLSVEAAGHRWPVARPLPTLR